MITKIKSIRKQTTCYMCQGTTIMYHNFDKKHHRQCSVCKGRGFTNFKLNYHTFNFEFEAMICNRRGIRRKQNKWCVEVFIKETIGNNHPILLEGGYKIGDTLNIHDCSLDGWGKSIKQAYNNAFKNVEKYLDTKNMKKV
jgi:hypothetical protein